jgi:hypothetical protein
LKLWGLVAIAASITTMAGVVWWFIAGEPTPLQVFALVVMLAIGVFLGSLPD